MVSDARGLSLASIWVTLPHGQAPPLPKFNKGSKDLGTGPLLDLSLHIVPTHVDELLTNNTTRRISLRALHCRCVLCIVSVPACLHVYTKCFPFPMRACFCTFFVWSILILLSNSVV